MSSAPLVMVSNRLPFEARRGEDGYEFRRSPGGLVTALEAALAERGGVWVGWPGMEQEPGAELPVPAGAGGVRYCPVALTDRDVALYYGGFANRTLWPLFHYFVARTRIDEGSWRAYQRVNERFAEAAAAAGGDDALVWIHDYQLMLVPSLLRRRAPRRRIAFFLHIPFPATDVFRILPWSRALLRGLLGADLVGFQVQDHVEHCMTCAERLLGCEVDRAAGLVQYEGRSVSVQAHPISIDVEHMERLARDAPPPVPDGRAEILSVDRLDYTKGIAQRLLAIERLLDRYDEWRGRVVFTQVVVPSRERVAEYQELKREVDELVGRVNGRFSDRGWAPIRYLNHSLPPEELAAAYRAAEVALVTPLRDGMNLVAKEYVAARVDADGVLVLSEMAGAAAELPEALIVNPYDVDAVADTLHRALAMTEEERRARMSALRDRLRANDVRVWLNRFIAAADTAHRRPGTLAPAERVRRRLAPWLADRKTVALFLDYDGTLTPIAARPEDARLSDDARRGLEAARGAPHLDVTIVSGRSLDDVRAMVGVEGLTYVGDHGAHIEGPGLSYHHAAAAKQAAQLEQAALALEALGVEGAWVERKVSTVAYHLRAVADPRAAAAASRRADAVLRKRGLAVLAGKAVIEGRPASAWDKGQAVLHVLRHRHGADWPARARALYVGDDATDEDAFRALRGIGRSILVTAGGTVAGGADYELPGPDDVAQLVRWLAAGAPVGGGGGSGTSV